MNKVEYLDALKVALKNTDKDIMDEIISDYEEHFQVGAENGKSEEQICEDLGSIDDLVKEIKEVYHTDKKSDKESSKEDSSQKTNENGENKGKLFEEWDSIFDNFNGEVITNAINKAFNTAGEALSNIDVKEIGKNVKKTVDQAASSLNSFADDYLKNQGNPFDFGRRHAEGHKENTSTTYDDSAETPQENKTESNVSFDVEDGKVEPTTEGSANYEATNEVKEEAEAAKVEKEEVKEEVEAAKVEKDEVKEEVEAAKVEKDEVKEEAKTNVESESTVDTKGIEQEVESKATGTENIGKKLNLVVDGICADIKVSKSSNGKVNINYENNGSERQKQMYEFYSYKEGDTVYAGIRKVGKAVFFFNFAVNSIVIHIELPECMSSIHIKTASGDLDMKQIIAEKIIAETASGDITINGLDAADIKVKSSSGDLDLSNITAVQFTASTMSGDLSSNSIDAKNLSLKSVSGDVDTRNLNSNILDLSSMSGDIDMMHVKTGESKIRSTSGDVGLKEFSMNYADVTTVSGDLKLSSVIGDGIRASSTSGDVRIDINVKKCHASSKSGSIDVTCLGDLSLEASSTSGNVNIHLKNYGNGYKINSRTTSGGLYIAYGEDRLRNLKTGTYTFGKQGSELVLGSVSGDIHVND